MSRRNHEPPLSRLHNMMAKAGITPRYDVIFEDYKRGQETFMMRITCPVRPGDPPVSADSCYCRSKKEAKHNAARVFMEKFFNSGNEPQFTMKKTSPKPTARAVIMFSKELDMLEVICSKKNLGKPEITDLGVAGLSRAPTFTSQCKVFGLCIEGKGNSAPEARLQAIVRMIQILTRAPSVDEILKLQKLTTSEIEHVLKSTQNNSVSSSTDQTSQQRTMQNGATGNQNGDPRSSEKPTEIRTISDKGQALLEFMNSRKKAQQTEDRNNNSVLNVNRMPSAGSKAKNVSDSVNDKPADSSSAVKFRENLTQLQVVSQIDRTLRTLEELLSDTLLNGLIYCKLSSQQTVMTPPYQSEVLVQDSLPPKVFVGPIECTDQSMRIACMAKLVTDLKKHIKSNQ